MKPQGLPLLGSWLWTLTLPALWHVSELPASIFPSLGWIKYKHVHLLVNAGLASLLQYIHVMHKMYSFMVFNSYINTYVTEAVFDYEKRAFLLLAGGKTRKNFLSNYFKFSFNSCSRSSSWNRSLNIQLNGLTR